MRKLEILIKTKGSHKQGMGDVTSSLALAERLKKFGHEVHFLINNDKSTFSLVSKYFFKINLAADSSKIKEFLKEKIFDIAVLNQLNTIKPEAGIFRKYIKFLVTIEDTGNCAQLADLRFNVLYPNKESLTDFCFIPLGESFQKIHKRKKNIRKKLANVLITQGGSDTYGFIPKIVRAMYPVSRDIKVNIVIGPNFLHYSQLSDALNKAPRKFNIIKGKDDLAEIMFEADLAITAAGNTLFELACVGIPAIVVCAERFEEITAKRMQNKGYGLNLGFNRKVPSDKIFESFNTLVSQPQVRVRMSLLGKRIIDGRGAIRMAENIIKSYYDY